LRCKAAANYFTVVGIRLKKQPTKRLQPVLVGFLRLK
jgi:hypothetical protein